MQQCHRDICYAVTGCRSLGPKRGGVGRTSAADASALLARGELIGLRLPALPQLHAALALHAEWEAAVQRALSSTSHPIIIITPVCVIQN